MKKPASKSRRNTQALQPLSRSERPQGSVKANTRASVAHEATAAAQTKTQVCLGLLRRKMGATLCELMSTTGWQAHSVRGFLSGTVKRKRGLTLTSTKDEEGERRYRLLRGREGA